MFIEALNTVHRLRGPSTLTAEMLAEFRRTDGPAPSGPRWEGRPLAHGVDAWVREHGAGSLNKSAVAVEHGDSTNGQPPAALAEALRRAHEALMAARS